MADGDGDGVPQLPVPRDRRAAARVLRANRLAVEAYERGIADALQEFVPDVIHSLVQVVELTPRVVEVIDRALDAPGDEGAVEQLKVANSLLRTVLGEQRYLLDRVHGKPVQHQRVESESVDVRVNVDASSSDGAVSLREVLRATREHRAAGDARDGGVVDVDVIG